MTPSFSGGMNSLLRRSTAGAVSTIVEQRAATTTFQRWSTTKRTTGAYAARQPAVDRIARFVVHLAADEEHRQRGRERDGQDRGEADGVGLGERERLEEAAFRRLRA